MQDYDSQTIEEFSRADKKARFDAINPIPYPILKEKIDTWLAIGDRGVVKLLCAVLVTQLFKSDPVWLFLITQSGGGKTELMQAMSDISDVYLLSSLTPQTFISGARSKDQETSLLNRLGTGKTLIFKDFTTILEMNYEAQSEILSQLREIYDGYICKIFGTGHKVEWSGRMGFIAGSTPILEQRFQKRGALGERFIQYYIDQPDRKEAKEKIKNNIGKEESMRQELRDAFVGFMKGIEIPKELPVVPNHIENKIDDLTDFVSDARAVVERERSNKQEIEYINKPEMPTRLYKQLISVATSLMIINKNIWKDEDFTILYKLGMNSIHSVRTTIVEELRKYKTAVKTSTMATTLHYSTYMARRHLEDLDAIQISKRIKQGQGKPDLWQLEHSYRKMLDFIGPKVEMDKSDHDFDTEEKEYPDYLPLDEKEHSLKENMTEEEKIEYGV